MTGIPLSSKLAGWLVTVGTFTVAVGTFMMTADSVPFGWGDAYDVGLSLNWIGIIANFAVVALRRNAVPGLTSGVGTEPAASTTTTLEVIKTINTEADQ